MTRPIRIDGGFGFSGEFHSTDGIVNKAPPPEMYYVTRVEDFHVQPGFLQALRVVDAKGYAAVVVTNQKCVARGLITLEGLEAIHDVLRRAVDAADLALTDILVCPHGDDECACRKPRPGMLLEAASRHGLDLAASWINRTSLEVEMYSRRIGSGGVSRVERCEKIVSLLE